MKIITGLSEQPKQQSTLVLADGTRAIWSISYVSQQTGWFYDLSWNGTVVATGQRMVSSPNILRQYINKISFGIAVVSPNQLEPTTQTALVDGTVTCYLLEGADLQAIETTIFNAPAGQVQPVGSTTAGLPVVVLPANWGPAGGDLAYAYPNPQVVAMHEGTGQRLAFGTVADNQFLKRVGATVVGATVAPGTGDVTGPASSTIGNVALWADAAGTEIADGGTLGTAAFANSSSFLGATAAASGDLSGNYPGPNVAAIHTTSDGGTQLTIGAIADGEYLVRSGGTLIGSVPSGAGDVFGPSSTVTVGTVALFATTDGKTLGPSSITLGTIASQAASNVTITGGSIAGAVITSGVGGSISGVPINGSTIGAVTASTGRFTSVVSTGNISASGTITATGTIGASNFSGTSSGSNTGDQTDISGNAATATALANARTIGGISFNGTANVTSFPVPGPIGGTTPNTGAFTTLTIGPVGSGSYRQLITDNDQSGNRLRFTNTGSGGQSWSIVGGSPGSSNVGLALYNETGSATVAQFTSAGLALTGTLSATGPSFTLAATGNDSYINFQNSSVTQGQIECYAGDMIYQTQTAGKNHIFRTDSGTIRATITSGGLELNGILSVKGSSSGQIATFRSENANGLYITYLNGSTAIGDIGSGYQTVSASASDFGVTSRSGKLLLGTNSSTRLTIDTSGNVGIGVTPSAWDTYKSLELPNEGYISSGSTWLEIMLNTYYGSGAYRYKGTGIASHYLQQSGSHIWYNAPSGTAGNVITFTQAMTLDANSNLAVTSSNTNAMIGFNAISDYFTPSGGSATPQYGIARGSGGSNTLGVSGYSGIYFYAYNGQRARIDNGGLAVTGAISSTGAITYGAATDGAFSAIFAGNALNGIQLRDSTDTSGAVFAAFRNGSGTTIGSISRIGTTNAVAFNGLATNVSGTVAIANGGTGLTSLGTPGQVLRVNAGATALEYVTPATGTVTGVTGTAPVVSTGGTTPAISMAAASASANGYLTSTDWTTFNNKQAAITLTTTGTSGAATLIGSTLNIPQYSGGGGGSGTVTTVSVVAANGVTGSVATPTTTPAITLTLGDISAATSKPSGTGAVARSFQSRDGDVFNVKDFGATGDGSTDDTAAIAAAFALACSTSKSGTLYFPSGTYLNNNTLTGSFGVHDQMYGFTIMGDGIGTTIIKQTVNPTSGTYKGVFNITNVSCLGCLTIKDLSFWNISGMSTDACIKYSVSEVREDDAHANLRVDNLFIGANFGSNTWVIGLDLYRVHNGNIYNYQYCGDNNRGGTGIVFQKYGSATTYGGNKSMACFIQGCQFNLCNTGVRLKDSMETCLIQESLMVGLVYGVYADYCIHLGVSNSHINVNPAVGAGVACIYSSGTGGDVDQSVIMGNLLYCQQTEIVVSGGSFVVGQSYKIATVGTTDFTLIGAASNTVGVIFTATGVGSGDGTAVLQSYLIGISGGFVRSSISGNSFIALGGKSGTRGLSISGKGLSITGNSFFQHTNSYITSSADYSIISSNTATYDAPATVAITPYSITGTGTTSVNNIYQP